MSDNEPHTILLEFCQPSSDVPRNVDETLDSSKNERLNYLDKREDQDCKLLMVCWSDHKHLFRGKSRKKDVFHKIAMVHLLPLQRRRKGVASDQPADLQQLKC